MKQVDVAIIGAGTAGLTARSAVARHTDSYVVIDHGPLGTLCARAGCMPSKALIQTANRSYEFMQPPPGLTAGSAPHVDSGAVMRHVRALRDHFVAGVLSDMDGWKDEHLIERTASFLDPQTLDLEGERLRAKSVIIATGSRPVVPESWRRFKDWLVTSDSLFDLEELPHRMAVIGLGPLGIELAQALHRLGVEVVAVDPSRNIGGLTDPALLEPAADQFGKEFTICFEPATLEGADEKALTITAGVQEFQVDQALAAVGRAPVIRELRLENLGIALNDKGLPDIDAATLQVDRLPVFMAGDVNGIRPLQHEAANEGRTAGHNALQPSPRSFDRLTPLSIVFCSPQIALVGRTHRQLQEDNIGFVTGAADFEQQGRARIMGVNAGQIRIYADRHGGRLLGAELFAPGGEHLAHLLAWAIAQRATASGLLKMPYYHPVLEEGLRGAITDASRQVKSRP